MSGAAELAGSALRERRGAERHVTVLMIGRVEHDAVQQACIIRNMSAHGLMARFSRPPTVGERLVVECRSMPPTVAVVRWSHGDVAGLELLDPLPTDRIGPRDLRRYVARGPRFGAELAAKVQHGSCGQIARLVNISAGGACVEGRIDAVAGSRVALTLPHLLGATPARIVWQADERFGLCFNMPLLFDALTRVVQAMPRECASPSDVGDVGR